MPNTIWYFRLSPPQTSYVGNAEAHGAVAEVIDSQPLGLIACSRQDTQNVTDDVVTSTDADCKWSCKMCTYKNWPRSIRCVQCYTKKGATAAETSPSREIGATSVASQRSSPIMAHSAMECNIIDTKSFIDPCPQAEASSNQHLLQERLSKMQIATNIDAEMNASNSAASAAGAAAAAQRLSPIEGSSTIHLNNLANNSSVQTQSTTTCLSSTSSNTQLASYTKKWACNVSDLQKYPSLKHMISMIPFFLFFRLVLMKISQKVSNVPCVAILVIVIVHLLPLPTIALKTMAAQQVAAGQ